MPAFTETRLENSYVTHTLAPSQIINTQSFNLLNSKQFPNLSF